VASGQVKAIQVSLNDPTLSVPVRFG